MVILGIDPGLATVGYGVIEVNGDKRRLVQYGTINTKAGEPAPARLRSIFQGINQLMDIYRPDDVAVEELFFSKNITTGIAVGEARGVILVAVAMRTENLYEYTPMQIKQAVTGYGGADKHQCKHEKNVQNSMIFGRIYGDVGEKSLSFFKGGCHVRTSGWNCCGKREGLDGSGRTWSGISFDG